MTAQIRYYNARGHDRELTAAQLPKVRITRDSLLWINGTSSDLRMLELPTALRGDDDMCELGEATVRVVGNRYCLAVPVFREAGGLETCMLDLIVGQDWLVSLGEGAGIDFAKLLENEVGETMKGKISGSTFAAALIADHIRRIHDRIGSINREIDRLEERVLTGREKRTTLQVMAVLRRQVSRLRAMGEEYRAVVHTLTRPDFLPEIDDADRKHFAHLLSLYERLEDEIARVRETVVASFELYATRVAQDTNRLVRMLTIVTIGIGFVGAMAGVFGMNFKAGIFELSDYGFYIAAGVMASILVATVGIAVVTLRKP